MSPGAALVFLLTGPATNIASLVVLAKQLGTRALALYLAAVAVGALSCGILVDVVFSAENYASGASAPHAADSASHGPSGLIASVVLLILAAASIQRTRLVPRWYAAIRRSASRALRR